jgi:site-specific DNA-methyltransferase (cytosine-N4-specific)
MVAPALSFNFSKKLGFDARVYIGQVHGCLANLEDQSVHSSIWSPPYWKQRDYGFKDQIGQEDELREYLFRIRNVFEDLERIVRDDGTVWLNIGDRIEGGFSHGVPWKVVDIVQEETAWRLVADIIWHKPNAMTETADGRPSRNHEYVFLFAKSKDYFYDRYGYTEVAKYQVKGDDRELRSQARSVWTINNQSTKVKHYAAFPVELPERCIRLSTSSGGCCAECGIPYEREVKVDRVPTRPGNDNKYVGGDGEKEASAKIGNKDTRRHVTFFETMGFHKNCGCKIKKAVPCTVLDPFGGIQRTGVACDRTGRSYIGIEYKREYVNHFQAEVERDRILRVKKAFLGGGDS